MKHLLKLFFGFLCLFTAQQVLAQDTLQHVVSGRFNSAEQQQKPYVILISADGFRYDLADSFHATHLQQFRAAGVQAEYMKPSYPSLTFPNHYAIITGLYPAHNGLVDNSFYDINKGQLYTMGNKKAVADSSWYGATPLWVLAEQQQMLSASFYWVASEAAIQGVRPTYYYIYNDKIGIDERIAVVKNWLQLPPEKRPHFITFYLPEVDHAEHTYGVNSKQTVDAVHFVDEAIAKLTTAIASLNLPVNYIFLSDHGMADVDVNNTLPLPSAIDTNNFIIPRSNMLLHLYAKNRAAILPTYQKLKIQEKGFSVYLANEIPERWHYNQSNDYFNRVGDILLVPHYPKVFNLGSGKITPGKHGYDNDMPEMRATFYAWGPAFKKHYTIRGFENIHVYPLIAKVLGLQYQSDAIDGQLKVLAPILKQ
ncbi:ectonucleotide pyrophosphatase/phosphodiesterase [Hydrotalea sp.]|uniref:alkaline phosphatase family protein n=1 Tax=Hydrotalea sp. TaxID=2881279 RepID=UPI0025859125|nr:ectonucleotide pyrophosphatase/phosphodiesterase [Hydrotalea sp.]